MELEGKGAEQGTSGRMQNWVRDRTEYSPVAEYAFGMHQALDSSPVSPAKVHNWKRM